MVLRSEIFNPTHSCTQQGSIEPICCAIIPSNPNSNQSNCSTSISIPASATHLPVVALVASMVDARSVPVHLLNERARSLMQCLLCLDAQTRLIHKNGDSSHDPPTVQILKVIRTQVGRLPVSFACTFKCRAQCSAARLKQSSCLSALYSVIRSALRCVRPATPLLLLKSLVRIHTDALNNAPKDQI